MCHGEDCFWKMGGPAPHADQDDVPHVRVDLYLTVEANWKMNLRMDSFFLYLSLFPLFFLCFFPPSFILSIPASFPTFSPSFSIDLPFK